MVFKDIEMYAIYKLFEYCPLFLTQDSRESIFETGLKPKIKKLHWFAIFKNKHEI